MRLGSRLRWTWGPALWVCALLSSAVAVNGQMNSGQITGIVKDPSGAVVPGATIVAEEAGGGHKFQSVTDPSGEFLLSQLPLGAYAVAAEYSGFKRSLQNGIVLHIGQTIRLQFVLELGDIGQQVVVTESAPLLKTTSAEISDIVEQRQVTELPLNGRQFLQLALLSEGVVIPPGGTRGAALQQAGQLVNVSGQRSGHNIYLLDGVKVTDEYFNNLVISPSIDAIQEFKIQKSMYPAEFGGKASALINVATKSGTNNFHGTLFEFLRNDKFDAKNFFDDPTRPIPPFRQNQFGGTLGGPVSIPGIYKGKGKVFFFANYEGQRIRKSLTKTFSVPTLAERSGNLQGFAPVYDPLTTDPATGNRLPFAGNLIPRSRIDPVAAALLARTPLPNRPGSVQNLVSSMSDRSNMDQGNLRLDHQLSPKDIFFARLSIFEIGDFQPFGSSVLNETLVPGFGRDLATHSKNFDFNYNHVISDSVVNELRLGWLSVSGGQSSQNKGVDFASMTGMQGVTNDARDVGYPQVSFAGLFSIIGDPTSFVSRVDRSWELYDNVLVHRGKHDIKFGAYYFHLNFNPSNPNTARGSFQFTPRWTSSSAGVSNGNAFADFLLGFPSSAQAGIGRAEEDGRTNWTHTYLQDDWKAAPTLTINLGLRYEVNQQMTDVNNRLSAIDLSVPGGRFVIASDSQGNISPSATPLLAVIPISHVTSKDAGWSRSLLRPSYNRYSPRVGLAWSRGQTVVRAGYGIFMNQWAYSVQQALAQNLPFFLTKNINSSAGAHIPTLTTPNILGSNGLGNIGGNDMDHNFRTEYNEAWSLGVERMWRSTLFEVSYFGSRTIGADSSTVLNVPVPGPGPIGPRRPVPQLSAFNSIRWNGWSTYNALTVKSERRYSSGLSFAANYTWSKSIDDASDPGATNFESDLPENVNNLNAEKALSSYDHRHRFVCSFFYDLPLGKGSGARRGKFLAGWQLGGVATVQSGAPFTANLGVDQANIGAGPAQRPDLIRNPNLNGNRNPSMWFDTSAFSLPRPFTFGSAGRNIVFSPGLGDLDFSLLKNTALTERARLEFRAEAFNAFNHPNFDVPNRIAFSPNFGRIFSAEDSRQIQLAIKLIF